MSVRSSGADSNQDNAARYGRHQKETQNGNTDRCKEVPVRMPKPIDDDGKDRAEIMRYEGKGGNLKPWEKRVSETAGL